jgi:hypothetical protein
MKNANKKLNDALIVVERSGSYLVSKLGKKVEHDSTMPGAMFGEPGDVGLYLSMAGLREEVAGLTLDSVLKKADDSGNFTIKSFGTPYKVSIKKLIYDRNGDNPIEKSWNEYIKSNKAESLLN